MIIGLGLISSPAFAQDPSPIAPDASTGVYQITAPIDGQPLFGLVEILGSASHPTLFDSYSLEWSNVQGGEVWLPIQPPIRQQVTNGILGQWDTATANVPDGVYQIRLQVFLTDGSIQEVKVVNLVLANAVPTPIPTSPALQITPVGVDLGGIGITATSVILQPPSVTPRPTFESPADNFTSDATTGDSQNTFINYNAAQSAFCNGVLFSLALFALVVLYVALRSQLSPYTRRLWWQIRSEFDNDRRG